MVGLQNNNKMNFDEFINVSINMMIADLQKENPDEKQLSNLINRDDFMIIDYSHNYEGDRCKLCCRKLPNILGWFWHSKAPHDFASDCIKVSYYVSKSHHKRVFRGYVNIDGKEVPIYE